MTELERLQAALVVAREALVDLNGADNRAYTGRRCNDAQEKIKSILTPEPEMEEVHVVRWECHNCGDVHLSLERCGCMSANYPYKESDFIELTGTYQRPKPRKVEKSVSVEVRVKGAPSGDQGQTILPNGYYAAFREYPETFGKTGLLTFTWSEEEQP